MTRTGFEIIQLGHPNLRAPSVAIADITSTELQSFIDKLLQFVIDRGGMGIAAVQVDVNQRLFIMCSRPNSRYPDAPEMAPTVVINPEVVWSSPEKNTDWEGCLSLPGIRGLVPRHNTIKVKFQTRNGAFIETEYSGFIARVFQHELDHLDGIVFLDRVESTHEIMMEHEWQQQIAKP